MKSPDKFFIPITFSCNNRGSILREFTGLPPSSNIVVLRFIFKGSEEFTISQHLDNLVNKKKESINLKKDSYYFVKFNDSKIIKMKIISNDNNNLTSDDMRHIDRKNCQVASIHQADPPVAQVVKRTHLRTMYPY